MAQDCARSQTEKPLRRQTDRQTDRDRQKFGRKETVAAHPRTRQLANAQGMSHVLLGRDLSLGGAPPTAPRDHPPHRGPGRDTRHRPGTEGARAGRKQRRTAR
eukprot:scaffold100024_cov57-Phaeocystis_antarctica.AAC.2